MRPLMPPVQTPDNLFHDGNPIRGELGTLVDANHLNNVQAAIRDAQSELISIMTAAGLAPDSSSVHQLLDALKTLFEAKDAALTSLASLVGSANTLPYFTGPDTLALTSLTATGRNLINKADVASIIQYLGLQNTINLAANALQRSGDNIAWLNVAQLLQAASMHVNQPGVADTQGLTIDWNRLGPGGATGFTNNRGLGAGGFVFQTVDQTNKIVYSTITFDVNGQILAPSNLCAGTAKFAIDGNSYGTIWGVAGGSDWLSNYLATKFSGIQNQFTAIPVNNTTGDISGTAWGGSLAVNLTTRFNAIPVDNPTGNIKGTQWGTAGGTDWLSNFLANKFIGIQNQFNALPINNFSGDINGTAWGGLLSAHLAAKWVGIQNQFNAIPVDNPSGNIHGSAWGNDWLSNYINNRFAAVANKLVMVSNVNGYFKDVTSGFLIQFGWIQSVTANAETSGFNIAFPNACAGIVANLGLPLNNGNSVYVKAENNQGFSYRTSTQGIGFYWFAWGY
ncbi:gp53-like domain-containing protein [Phytobacter diazotrophicus]|uniref:gp53-like domain-containing protein n=1 Tax=Phytobacter diazotrophicus TaxID=395631 RepID=UPI002FF6161E